MTVETKTAKDLPAGSEVSGRYTTWTKDRPERTECWTSSTGGYLSDGQIDWLIADGAFITFIPSSTGGQ